MKNKHFYFLIVLAAFSLFLFCIAFAGCSAENPICSTNFCAVGEIFPRSELQEGQAFSEVDIDDAVIFATLVGGATPVETTPVEALADDAVTLADIVNDVAVNGVNSTYKGQTVTITAPVRFKFDATDVFSTALSLFTYNERINFFVNDAEGADDLADLNADTTYVFKLKIDDIKRDTSDPNDIDIWSDVLGTPAKTDAGILDITLNQLVTSASTGNQTYVGKTIKLNATVQLDNIQLGNQGGISLITNNPRVLFFVVDIQNPAKLNRYKSESTYQFVLHIQSVEPDEDNPNEYTILSGIAND